VDTINELLIVLVITALGICAGFGKFLYDHEKESKKEIRKAGNNKNSDRQHDKSGNDEPSGASTAPATSTKTTETPRSI
jgi:hypothetical protein